MTEELNFRGKRSNETVIMIAKQHPWLLAPVALSWVILLGLIAVSLWHFGASQVTSYVIGSAVIIGALYSFYQWFLWNNGINIITNQRVIKIEQISLFSRQIAEAEVDRIQEISTDIKGPIHTLLNFGTVKIRTASDTGKMNLDDVADPYDIQQEIVRVQRQTTEQHLANGHNPTGITG